MACAQPSTGTARGRHSKGQQALEHRTNVGRGPRRSEPFSLQALGFEVRPRSPSDPLPHRVFLGNDFADIHPTGMANGLYRVLLCRRASLDVRGTPGEVVQVGQSRQPAAGPSEPVSVSPPPGVPDARERDAILDRVNRHPPLQGSSEEGGTPPAGTESKPGK